MIIVGSKRTGEFYTRRSWFGLGKPITLERIECQAVELDMTGRGEQFSVTRWERVDSFPESQAPCADCGEWYPTRMLEHCSGDAGCEQCPTCAQKYEGH